MKAKVIIIEDEPEISELIELYLAKEGIETLTCATGEEGLEALSAGDADLLILDLNLPGIDGYEVLESLRRSSTVPVIIVSARIDDSDMILGFGYGADDFVQKPFSPKVLAARVRAHIRREVDYKQEREAIRFGPYRLHPESRLLKRDGERLFLSPKEIDVLIALAQNKGKPRSSEELYQQVWSTSYGDIATVSVHIQRLRKKIEEDPSDPKYLKTSHGFGYYLAED